MKKTLEKLKDILYDSIDYLIMLGIIGIVVFIIAWRLDLLFANDAKDLIAEDFSNNNSSDFIIDNNKEVVENKDLLIINIPTGSNTSDIATILESNKLISKKSDFIDITEEKQLSNNLKAGNYEIPSNSPIDVILDILTK